MAPRELILTGTSSSDRLFANKRRLDQTYYRYLQGFEGNDLLYGNIGIVKLEGGSGADTFILSNRAGGTATTDYVAILDYSAEEGDAIALAGILQPGDVEILDVAEADLAILNNSFDPYRVSASIGDSFLRSRTTGEILGVVKSTSSGSIQLSGNITGSLTASEQQMIAPQNGGRIPVQNFNTASPADGVRIVEFADLSNIDFPAYYLSAGAYATYAGGTDTYNKFVSFDFTDPPAPYGTYINGRVGPLQHTHANELETFFVVSGTYTFTDGMQTGVTTGELSDVEVGPGTVVVGPQGFVHGFRAKQDDGPGRIFSWALPAGLDTFFQNSGTKVSNRYAQIVPNSASEAQNTAFWAGQRGDTLFLTPWDLEQMGPGGSWANPRPPYTGSSVDGRQIPTLSAIWPQMMSPSIDSSDRPIIDTVFGENRRSLVTTSEAGDITGKTAWKGALGPKQPGGTFSYDSLQFKSGTNTNFSRSKVVAGSSVLNTLEGDTPSAFDVIYTLTDGLTLKLFDQPDPTNPAAGNNPTYDLDALTFVQLPAGTRYALSNTSGEEAAALSIHTLNSPIAPDPIISSKNNLLSVKGQSPLTPLKFKLDSVGGGVGDFTQVAVVPTDSKGRLLPQASSHHSSQPIKPSSSAFKLEALKQAKLITTIIDDSKIQPKGSTSTLSNFTSDNLLFITVKNKTLAQVLQNAERGNRNALGAVKFGSSAVSLSKGSSRTVKVDGKGSDSFTMRVKPGTTGKQVYGQDYRSGIDVPNGRFNWNYKENLLGFLDLTYSNNRYADIQSGSLRGALVNVDSITGMTGASGSATGQALAFGFYQIQDEKGTVFDPLTLSPIEATAENKERYLQTVLMTANSPGKGFSQTGSTNRLNTNLEGGYLYAPFVQIMGRTGPELYLPFSSVSADQAQHVVPVANNAWGLNTSPDPGRSSIYDTKMSLNLNIAPPFVLPPV